MSERTSVSRRLSRQDAMADPISTCQWLEELHYSPIPTVTLLLRLVGEWINARLASSACSLWNIFEVVGMAGRFFWLDA